MSQVFIKEIQSRETHSLRENVLGWRDHYESLSLGEDEYETTTHFGCFKLNNKPNKPIGIATVVYSVLDIPTGIIPDIACNKFFWKIRGMAIHESFRNQHLGTLILSNAIKHIHSKDNDYQLWADVRINAVDFYKKNKFFVISEKFIIGSIGEHIKMVHADPDVRIKKLMVVS